MKVCNLPATTYIFLNCDALVTHKPPAHRSSQFLANAQCAQCDSIQSEVDDLFVHCVLALVVVYLSLLITQIQCCCCCCCWLFCTSEIVYLYILVYAVNMMVFVFMVYLFFSSSFATHDAVEISAHRCFINFSNTRRIRLSSHQMHLTICLSSVLSFFLFVFFFDYCFDRMASASFIFLFFHFKFCFMTFE